MTFETRGRFRPGDAMLVVDTMLILTGLGILPGLALPIELMFTARWGVLLRMALDSSRVHLSTLPSTMRVAIRWSPTSP